MFHLKGFLAWLAIWSALSPVGAVGAKEQRNNPSACNGDNCLRALRAEARSADSHAFCSAYISQNTVTVTIIQTGTVFKDATTTSRNTSITTTTTSTRTTTSTFVQTNLTTTTKTNIGTATIHLRDANAIPTYLSACSANPSRLSSACSCYIGTRVETTTTQTTLTSVPSGTSTVVSSLFFTETDLVTNLITKTSTTTATETENYYTVATHTIACRNNDQSLNSVQFRIEGPNSTIVEERRTLTSGPANITTPSGGTHACNGLNNNANALPGATCTSALDEAACELGFSWDGTWSSQFDDFFITRIANISGPWGVLRNYQLTPVGGCQQETKDGDYVLWAYNATNAKYFLQASADPEFTTQGCITGQGIPCPFYVRDGASKKPVEGAVIGGVKTNGSGIALLYCQGNSGFRYIKAELEGSIRSNELGFGC